MKRMAEVGFWRKEILAEGGRLYNDHYPRLFKEVFGLEDGFFSRSRILDVGCGPAGSLEWAAMATLRVGLDPLASTYRELGTDSHRMSYVEARSECVPFPDGCFDVVSSFNSLDHVDDLDQTLAEVARVLRPGGSVLLIVEVNHPPTVTEPVTLRWDVLKRFHDAVEVVFERRFEVDGGMYPAILAGMLWEEVRHEDRTGAVVARLVKLP